MTLCTTVCIEGMSVCMRGLCGAHWCTRYAWYLLCVWHVYAMCAMATYVMHDDMNAMNCI